MDNLLEMNDIEIQRLMGRYNATEEETILLLQALKNLKMWTGAWVIVSSSYRVVAAATCPCVALSESKMCKSFSLFYCRAATDRRPESIVRI